MTEIKASGYSESLWRHQRLSNEKIHFFLDRTSGTIHDKRCKALRNIPDERIVCLQDYDFGCNQCRKCAADAYVRIGAKDPEDYQEYRKYFMRVMASVENVKLLYVDSKMRTRLERNSLKIWCKEDVWIIQSLDDKGNVQLKHNNYHKNSDGSRRHASGFHIQNDKCRKCRLKYALDVISRYDYQDHFINHVDTESILLDSSAYSATQDLARCSSTQAPVVNDISGDSKTGCAKNIFNRFALGKRVITLINRIKRLCGKRD